MKRPAKIRNRDDAGQNAALAPLKTAVAQGVFTPPAASSLAAGLNIGTVVSVQNHWREYYNPLPALDIRRAIALYDFARRGLNAELQNVYREMEGLYPTLVGLIERRTSPLLEMEWECKAVVEDKLPKGATKSMAEDQAAALQDAYDGIDNLYDAIEWLELGAFRGYAHLEKCYANPGTADLTVSHLEPVEQWHWTRKSMYAEWEYVAAATQTNIGVPINYGQFVIHEVRRPLDRIALLLWIRANLAEKDWDAFIELYGIPAWIVIMPPGVPPEKESEYRSAAMAIANGGRGALPNGATAESAKTDHKGDVFRPRLDWLQEQLVLAGTGGLLSMLAMPTGMNSSASTTHDDAFNKIARKESRKINEVFNRQFDQPILDSQFPGQPRLAYFELCAKEETDPSAICTQALQLFQAGYQMDAAELSEKTGYKLTIKAPPPAPIQHVIAAPGAPLPPKEEPADPKLPPAKITNRAAADVSSDLVASAAAQYGAGVQKAFKPLADRLYAILELDDPGLETTALKKLQAELNDPKSAIIKAIMANPAGAQVLAGGMAAGLLNGMAENIAGRSVIKNRRNSANILNRDDDGDGHWVTIDGEHVFIKEGGDSSGGGAADGHVKLRGAKVQKATDKAFHVSVQTDEGSTGVWLPKSQVSFNKKGDVHASPWIIGQKENEMADRNRYDTEHAQPRILTGDEPTAAEKSAHEAWRQKNAFGA